MAAAELTGGGDEGGAAQMWNAARPWARLSSFHQDLLRVLSLQVLEQRRRAADWLLSAVRVCDLAVQPVCALAIASRQPTAPTARRQRQARLLCLPLFSEPVADGRRAFAVRADQLAFRREEDFLAIVLDVVELRIASMAGECTWSVRFALV